MEGGVGIKEPFSVFYCPNRACVSARSVEEGELVRVDPACCEPRYRRLEADLKLVEVAGVEFVIAGDNVSVAGSTSTSASW